MEEEYIIRSGNGDTIKSPNHYKGRYGMETIEVIENFTDDMDGYEGYCTGNIIKYICRWKNKNGIEDLRKAKQYIEFLIKYESEE